MESFSVKPWLDNMAEATGMNVNSPEAIRQMDFTQGIESRFGQYDKPLQGGQATGRFMLMPKTRAYVNQYMQTRQPKAYQYWNSLQPGDERDAVMARMRYWPAPAMPTDPQQMLPYWNKYFGRGAAMPEQETIDNAMRLALQWNPVQPQQSPLVGQPMGVPSGVTYPLNMGQVTQKVRPVDELIQELSYTPVKKNLFNIDVGGSQALTTPGKLGRVARKWVKDPISNLGKIMKNYQETGKLDTKDALDFAMSGLVGGEPGGLPAGAIGAGSVTRTKIPFTSRLSKLMERGMIGDRVISPKTKLGEVAKMLGKDKILSEEYELLQGTIEQIAKDLKITPEQVRLNKVMEKYPKVKEKIAPEKLLDKTMLTEDDTHYKSFESLREQDGDYYEVLYNDPSLDYEAEHFAGNYPGEPKVNRAKGYVSHRRGTDTSSLEDSEMSQLFTDARNIERQLEAVNKEISQMEKAGTTETDAVNYQYLRDLRTDLSDQKYDLNESMFQRGAELRNQIKNNTKQGLQEQLKKIEETIANTDPVWVRQHRRLDEEWNDIQRKLDNFSGAEDTAHTTEVQSDLHQQASKAGGYAGTEKLRQNRDKWNKQLKDLQNNSEYEAILDSINTLEEERELIDMQIDYGIKNPSKIKTSMKELIEERKKITQQLKPLDEKRWNIEDRINSLSDRLSTTAPEYYPKGKTYWKTNMMDAMADAVDQGKKFFTWTTGETQAKRNMKKGVEAQGYLNKYDRDFVKFIEQTFGIKPTKRFIPDSNQSYGVQEVWSIPISDAVKKLMQNRKNLPMAKRDTNSVFG